MIATKLQKIILKISSCILMRPLNITSVLDNRLSNHRSTEDIYIQEFRV
jgi:hypothetical protein